VPRRDCVEFLDERGRPVARIAEDDPVLADPEPLTLPRWLDPRTSVGRTVLGSLLVVFAAWLLSVRQGQVDTAPAPAQPQPTFSASPVVNAPEPVGPGTYRDGSLGTLRGPARQAAKLLGRLGQGDGVIPPGSGTCAPGGRGDTAEERVAAAVRTYLPSFGIITATTGLGTHAQLCTLVLWAEHGSMSVAVSVAAPTRPAPPATTQWQILSSRSGTLEWVRRVDSGRWTVLVAAFGPSEVPGLSELLQLADDPLLTW
jgi:hypothetical protein